MEAVRVGACFPYGSGGRQLADVRWRGVSRGTASSRCVEAWGLFLRYACHAPLPDVDSVQACGARTVTHDPSVSVPRRGELPTRRCKPRDAEVYDQPLFIQTLSRFAVVLPARYDLEAALSELTESLTAVLGLSGSGVTMADEAGRLRFVTAVSQASGELERNQEEQQAGPCRDAYQISVALNRYSPEPRDSSDEDIAVAGVLADVATSYVVNDCKLRQQEQLSEQLQHALESRIVIEQAKGITAEQNSVTVDQAYQLMRSHARNNNASLRLVAEAIVAVGLTV